MRPVEVREGDTQGKCAVPRPLAFDRGVSMGLREIGDTRFDAGRSIAARNGQSNARARRAVLTARPRIQVTHFEGTVVLPCVLIARTLV